MKRTRLAAILLGVVLTTLYFNPNVFAEESNTQGITDPSSVSVPVTYEQESTFTVTIPKSITLDSSKTANFTYAVKGDLAGNEKVSIANSELQTIQMTDSHGKGAQDVLISLDTTEFTADLVNGDNATGNGKVDGSKLSAGDWSGTIRFVITKTVQ